jgi:hypothetical protein
MIDVVFTNTSSTANFRNSLRPSGNDNSAATFILWQDGFDCIPCSYVPYIIDDDEIPACV